MGFNITNMGYEKDRQSSGQDIWGPQANALQNLYQGSTDFFNTPNQNLQMGMAAGQQAIPGIMGYANQAMPAWANLMQGGTFGQQPLDVSNVNSIAGGYNPAFGTMNDLQQGGTNPYLQQMGQSGLDQMFQNYSRNVNPNITGGAEMSGGMGGSRQGIAEGNALGDLFSGGYNFLGNLYGGQYQSDQNRRLAAAQSSIQGQLSGINQARMIGQGADATGIQALGQGQNAMNLGFAAPGMYNTMYGMETAPFNQYSAMLGRPTPLNWSQGEGVGYNLGF